MSADIIVLSDFRRKKRDGERIDLTYQEWATFFMDPLGIFAHHKTKLERLAREIPPLKPKK